MKCFRPFVASWPAPSASGRSESGRVGVSPTELVHLSQGTHNNRCENAIRPFVVGRKGWLFSDSVKVAVASANLYSLVETAKANGVEPHAYLSLLFAQLPYLTTVEDYETMLPWNVRPVSPSSAQRPFERETAFI